MTEWIAGNVGNNIVSGDKRAAVFLMVRKPVWWRFLRIGDDGWSSEFQSVDRLLRRLERQSRSVASRDVYCYNLWRICTSDEVKKRRGHVVDPDELILSARKDPDAVTDVIQAFANRYNRKESVRYANSIIYLAKSFFKANKVELDLHNYFQRTRSRKRPEYIPSWKNGEALRMADVAGSLRNRLIIEFLIYTGLRNSTLRALVYNESYPEPLLQEHTVKKELERGEQYVMIIVHEVMKKHVPNACKNKLFYYTFIPPKVTDDLRLYLKEREEKYGPIQDDEPIFITENRRVPLSERRKTPISARELQEIVKNAAKRAGIKYWKHVYPHCLRKTYESFLRNQPDNVRLDVKEREFLFGHTLPGSQDTYFDKAKIEEIRAKYAKMIFEPIAGVEEEERVICEDELEAFLQQGWRYEATTPSGKIVVYRKTIVKQPTEVKAAGKAQIPSNTSVEKENSSVLSKSLGENGSSRVNFLTSQHQPIQQSIGNKYDKISKKEPEKHGLQRWISPPEVEPSPTPAAKATVEEKEHITESTLRNKVPETKQRSLSDFLSDCSS